MGRKFIDSDTHQKMVLLITTPIHELTNMQIYLHEQKYVANKNVTALSNVCHVKV